MSNPGSPRGLQVRMESCMDVNCHACIHACIGLRASPGLGTIAHARNMLSCSRATDSSTVVCRGLQSCFNVIHEGKHSFGMPRYCMNARTLES